MSEETLDELLADYLRCINEFVDKIYTPEYIEQKLHELHERIRQEEESS